MKQLKIQPGIEIYRHGSEDEKHFVDHIEKLDFDINGEKDFELEIKKEFYDQELFKPGNWIHLLCDTPFNYQKNESLNDNGGMITSITRNSTDDIITIKGQTVRGVLNNKIIYPDGDYYIIPANDKAEYAVSDLYNYATKDAQPSTTWMFFSTENTLRRIPTKSYQFNRYCHFLDGLDRFLADNDLAYWLNVGTTRRWIEATGERLLIPRVYIKLDPKNDYTDEYISGNYTGLNYQVTTTYDTHFNTNFIVGLGQGELSARDVCRYRRAFEGETFTGVVESPLNETYTNLQEIDINTYVFENTNAETLDDLKKQTKQHFEDMIQSENSYELSIDPEKFEYDLDIGDRIGCYDSILNTKIKGEVTNKIIRIERNKVSVEYTLNTVKE